MQRSAKPLKRSSAKLVRQRARRSNIHKRPATTHSIRTKSTLTSPSTKTTRIAHQAVRTQQIASFSTENPGFFQRLMGFFSKSKPSAPAAPPQAPKGASTPDTKPAPIKAPEQKPAAQKKTEPVKATASTAPPAAAASQASAKAVPDGPPAYVNRPTDLSGVSKATGKFVPHKWEQGKVPVMSKFPAPTGVEVTDGKVIFDKAALSIPGVFPTRAEELAQQQKAIDLKKDAAAATATANDLHGEANKLYDAGDKAGNKTKMAESKEFREKAQKIHQESFDLAYDCAMSMTIKALYSKLPSVDYHVFLLDPYEKSLPVVLVMLKTGLKFPRKDVCIIPGEGQHSAGGKALIPPHFLQYLKDKKIQHTKLTEGSYVLQLDSIKL